MMYRTPLIYLTYNFAVVFVQFLHSETLYDCAVQAIDSIDTVDGPVRSRTSSRRSAASPPQSPGIKAVCVTPQFSHLLTQQDIDYSFLLSGRQKTTSACAAKEIMTASLNIHNSYHIYYLPWFYALLIPTKHHNG